MEWVLFLMLSFFDPRYMSAAEVTQFAIDMESRAACMAAVKSLLDPKPRIARDAFCMSRVTGEVVKP